MEITIDGVRVRQWNECNVKLTFNSVSDTFSFKVFFDPENSEHKRIFRPLSFLPCTITHGGVLVLTGVVLNHTFMSAGDPPCQLVQIDGYSATGVLDDSCVLNATTSVFNVYNKLVPVETFNSEPLKQGSLQFNGLTLEQIAILVCKPYGISVVIDDDLNKDASISTTLNTPYPSVQPEQEEMVSEYLSRLCKGKNLVLSHTNKAELLITQAKSNKLLTTRSTIVRDGGRDIDTAVVTVTEDRAVLFDFTTTQEGIKKWTNMSLQVNGQGMHRIVQVVGQYAGTNPIDTPATNPLIGAGVKRFIRYIQKASTDDNETPLTARFCLNKELRGVQLQIDIEGWTLGGNLVTPNQMITVVNPDLYLYEKNGIKPKFFIQEVTLSGDSAKETATLTCSLPQAFNNESIINIFA